jgi:hypothetical protein
MNGYLTTFEGTLILLMVAVLAHEPFRWLGLYFGRQLPPDSELFVWVRAVATALVAALVMRLVIFPAGDLAEVSIWVRAFAGLSGVALYFAARKRLAAGVIGGALVLVIVSLMTK